jgi:hypothetical protein
MTYKKLKNCEKCKKEMIVRTSTHRFCKDCLKIHYNEWRRKYYTKSINKEKHSITVENWRKNNLKKKRENQKKYIDKNPDIAMAHKLAKQVPLKSSCEICNSENNLQRHHWRYDKPLLVNTLCKECHDIQHVKHFNESCFGRN